MDISRLVDKLIHDLEEDALSTMRDVLDSIDFDLYFEERINEWVGDLAQHLLDDMEIKVYCDCGTEINRTIQRLNPDLCEIQIDCDGHMAELAYIIAVKGCTFPKIFTSSDLAHIFMNNDKFKDFMLSLGVDEVLTNTDWIFTCKEKNIIQVLEWEVV